MAQYRRWRAADRRTWRATLPKRVAGVLAAGVVVALATTVVVGPGLARVTGPAAALALAWLLRFRPSPATLAWRHGAEGERQTARLLAPLERHGYQVFHDLAVPGSPANVDHGVVGPTGVFVIDSKRYRGQLRYLGGICGMAADPGPDAGDVMVGGHPGRRDPRVRPRPARLPGAASISPACPGIVSCWWTASPSLAQPRCGRRCRSSAKHCRPSRLPWSPIRSVPGSDPLPDSAQLRGTTIRQQRIR
jgi:hypothetical protein